MGGEDFSYYLQEIPGCYIRIGARPSEDRGFPAHSNRFDFGEAALPIGANWLAEVARRAGAALQNGAFDLTERFEEDSEEEL
jgi:hippurate hydrolase